MEIYEPTDPDTLPAQRSTITDGPAVTVVATRLSEAQHAIDELVQTLDLVLLARQETIYHARRPDGDTINFTMLRGEFNHIKRIADKHRIDRTQGQEGDHDEW